MMTNEHTLEHGADEHHAAKSRAAERHKVEPSISNEWNRDLKLDSIRTITEYLLMH